MVSPTLTGTGQGSGTLREIITTKNGILRTEATTNLDDQGKSATRGTEITGDDEGRADGGPLIIDDAELRAQQTPYLAT